MMDDVFKVADTESMPGGAHSALQSTIHSPVRRRVALPLSSLRRISWDSSLTLRRQDGKSSFLHLPGAIEGCF